jgi:hypothetical protein
MLLCGMAQHRGKSVGHLTFEVALLKTSGSVTDPGVLTQDVLSFCLLSYPHKEALVLEGPENLYPRFFRTLQKNENTWVRNANMQEGCEPRGLSPWLHTNHFRDYHVLTVHQVWCKENVFPPRSLPNIAFVIMSGLKNHTFTRS